MCAKKQSALDVARKAGSARYFTGSPCVNGHTAERITANKTCVVCYAAICSKSRLNRLEKIKQWHKDNRIDQREKQKARHLKNPLVRRKNNDAWAKANPEKNAETKRNWADRNPGYIRNSYAKRRAAKLNATPEWANSFFISEIYELARRRRRLFATDFHVDHIVPLQSKIVCGLHCEANMQILSGKQNMSKGNRFWPNMPSAG